MTKTLVPIILIILTSSCIINPQNGKIVEGKGTVVYVNLEGGFYGIIADNGKHYDPINLPSHFRRDGLRVWFKGKIRDDLGSFHMWGTIIELIEIKRI